MYIYGINVQQPNVDDVLAYEKYVEFYKKSINTYQNKTIQTKYKSMKAIRIDHRYKHT